MSKSMTTALLASVLLVVCVSAAVGEADLASRRLLVVKKKFPFTDCAKAPAGSPYVLAGPVPQVKNGVLNVNLTLIANPTSDSSNTCYAGLVNNVKRIEFRSGIKCAQPDTTTVYVNGVQKTDGVKWTVYKGQGDAILSLANLKLGPSILGTTISVLVSGDCNSPVALTGHGGKKLVYTITPGPKTVCCPVSSWDWGVTWSAGPGEESSSEESTAETSQIPTGEESSSSELSA